MSKKNLNLLTLIFVAVISSTTLNPAWSKDFETLSGSNQSLSATQKESARGKVTMLLSDHIGPSTEFTSQQREEIQNFLIDNPKAKRLICTGTILPNQTNRMNQIVAVRAQSSCDFAKELSPAIKTSHKVTNTQRENLNGRVFLLLK